MKGPTIVLAAAVLVFLGVGTVQTQEEMPSFPAIDSGESMPNGCVSCHLPSLPGPDGAPMDVRLSVILPQLVENHPNISTMAASREIPTLCGTCHNGDRAPEGATFIHRYHFLPPARGGENHFVAMFGGQCMMCHTLNTETGVMGVKSGMEATP